MCVGEFLKSVPLATLLGAIATTPAGAVLANGIGVGALLKDIYDIASEYDKMNKAEKGG